MGAPIVKENCSYDRTVLFRQPHSLQVSPHPSALPKCRSMKGCAEDVQRCNDETTKAGDGLKKGRRCSKWESLQAKKAAFSHVAFYVWFRCFTGYTRWSCCWADLLKGLAHGGLMRWVLASEKDNTHSIR